MRLEVLWLVCGGKLPVSWWLWIELVQRRWEICWRCPHICASELGMKSEKVQFSSGMQASVCSDSHLPISWAWGLVEHDSVKRRSAPIIEWGTSATMKFHLSLWGRPIFISSWETPKTSMEDPLTAYNLKRTGPWCQFFGLGMTEISAPMSIKNISLESLFLTWRRAEVFDRLSASATAVWSSFPEWLKRWSVGPASCS